MIAPRSAANLLLLCAGLVVWSSAFLWLYAALSVGCAFGWEERAALGPFSLQRSVLVGLWLAHLAAIALLLLWTRRRLARAGPEAGLDGFFARAVHAATIVSLAVTVINYVPILGLSACL